MANQARKIALVAPLTGKVVAIENVPDQTFSEKMMGDGLAIEPTDGKVVAPVDGEVVVTFPTKHAVGLKTASGMELLIHVGLETVHMDGEGFDMHVKQGDKVKAGDLLLTFDLQLIKKKAASHITPVIITTGELVQSIRKTNDGTVIAGESTLLEITLKGQSEESSKEKVVTQSGMEYSEEAKQIVEAIGGIENINAATHCVTRLRFALDNEDIVDKDKLEKIDVVKGTFSANGQFQIVIGQGTVDKVYKALVHETGIKEATKEEVKAAGGQKLNPLQRGIKVLADIFIPILPAIVMAGLLLGLNNILVNPIFTDQPIIEMYPSWAGVADMINVIANTAFTFLPALIGWSAVKRFGGNPLLGIVLGLILVHPSLMPASDYAVAAAKGEAPTWNLFGFEVNMMVIKDKCCLFLVASWVLASIERWLRKRVIDSLQLLVVAPVALLVTGFLAFIVIGPVTFTIGNWITNGLIAIFEAVPLIGGLIYGLFYAPLVITGMHHTFLAVDLQLIGSTGSTFLWPIVALSNIAQGSAVFAMFLATKNEKLKGLAGTSGISAWLGVTEPAMFGVNLQYRYPFIAAIIGAAIAGALITVSNVQASSIGVGGIPGFLSISNSIGAFFIGMLIVIVVPFIITFIIAKRKQLEN